MAVEEPVGFTEDGRLITGWRFTTADIADIGMATELHWTSPDGQQQLRDALDGLPRGEITITGYPDDGRS
jgi:hypothetical protein